MKRPLTEDDMMAYLKNPKYQLKHGDNQKAALSGSQILTTLQSYCVAKGIHVTAGNCSGERMQSKRGGVVYRNTL